MAQTGALLGVSDGAGQHGWKVTVDQFESHLNVSCVHYEFHFLYLCEFVTVQT
jgi:hypothetical protein